VTELSAAAVAQAAVRPLAFPSVAAPTLVSPVASADQTAWAHAGASSRASTIASAVIDRWAFTPGSR
jgi:small neutral amino acid transporter SnatA (MarC family)